MSKGLGKTQREIINCLADGTAQSTFTIACAVYECDEPTQSQTTTTRRAIRQLERAGLVCCNEYKTSGFTSLFAWLSSAPAPKAEPYTRTDGREFESLIVEALSSSHPTPGLPIGTKYRRLLSKMVLRGYAGNNAYLMEYYVPHYNRALHRLCEAGVIRIGIGHDSFYSRSREIVTLTQNLISVATWRRDVTRSQHL